MKILYWKGYKWLLSQNKRVRIDFSGYRQHETLAKDIKLFNQHLSIMQLQNFNCNLKHLVKVEFLIYSKSIPPYTTPNCPDPRISSENT